jgi:hypothetical protein
MAIANPRDDLEATAFRAPDGIVVVVAMNRTDAPIPMAVRVGDEDACGELPPHAILTLVTARGA